MSRNRYVVALLTVGWMTSLGNADARTWSDAAGKHEVEAELIDFNDEKIWLRRDEDRRVFVILLAELSRPDRQHVGQLARRRREIIAADAVGGPRVIAYGTGRKLCELANPLIDESSGLACSRARPGAFFTHNDSGSEARIFAFDVAGGDLGHCLLADTRAYDWEDMASFTHAGKHYLLLADTGNNGLAASVQMLHLVEEPAIHPVRGITAGQIPVVQTIHFSYFDDHRDCEALAVDPTDRTILLVTKQRDTQCYVYAMPWPKDDREKVFAARKIATLEIPAVTAMDISPDGRRAIVLTYSHAYEYTRGTDEDWPKAFSRRGRMLAMPRRDQGESICYGADGKTLYLTSEGKDTPLFSVAPN
ncbi:MAG: SHD1 domain-containing protein [Thermoguttaceae bacterium]